MGDISAHFSRKEFACKCGCGFDTVDTETLAVAEVVREHFGQPVTVNCGCRCRKHNAEVGGEENSQHLYGRAFDFTVRAVAPAVVCQFLKGRYPDKYGIGKYDTFTHFDSRTNGPARWKG